MTRSPIGLALCVLVVLAGCDKAPEPAKGPVAEKDAHEKEAEKTDSNLVRIDPTMLRDLRITTAPVEFRSSSEDASLLGELSVDQRTYAEVGVPIAARAVQLLSAPGDHVTQGQVLLELQSPEVGRAKSEYLAARARADLAEGTLKRKRELAAERIAPAREVQEAEAAANEARAAVRAATTTLASVGLTPPGPDDDVASASTFTLKSPIDGTVIDRQVSRGQMLDPATTVFRIGDLSTLWLTVHAFERDAVRITPGAVARLSFPALPGESFRGVVGLVGREVAKASRTVPVRIDIDNRSGRLRPGMSATALVPVGKSSERLLSVPLAAVQRVKDEWCVFIPKEGGTYEIRKIGRGRDLGTEVEVLSGLTAGDKIVVEGAFLLKAQAEKGAGEHGHGGHP
jgi:cobalt-zinc-cadmium efflux system membrane fusion protein